MGFFGGRFFGGRFFGGRMFGGSTPSVSAPVVVSSAGLSRYFGGRFFGGRLFGGRFFGGSGSDTPEPVIVVAPPVARTAIPRLQTLSRLGTGRVVETLDLLAASTTDQIDNAESATFRIRIPTRFTLSLRMPLRFRGSDGVVREYRLRRIVRDPFGRWADLEGAPPFYDLATSGLIREIVDGALVTSFGGTLTIAQWIRRYVLTNLNEDGLTWLDTVLGEVQFTQLVTLQFEQWTRGQLLRALADAVGGDLVVAQPGPGLLYRISVLKERGGALMPIRVAKSGVLRSLSIDSSDEGIATIVQPLGDTNADGQPASIAQHVFTVLSIAAGGWVRLFDPTDVETPPIGIDAMVNGMSLQFTSGPTTLRREILDSRASDGAVKLADTTGLAIGTPVTIVRDALGTPLTTLMHPAGIGRFDRVTVPLPVAGMRGEANLVPNANFALGDTQWSARGLGWLESYPVDEVTDLVASAAGGVSSGATSFTIDGVRSGAVVRRGERVEVGAVTLGSTSAVKTVPSTLAVTVPLAAGLAESLVDGQGLSEFVNGLPTGRLYLAAGAQSAGTSSLALTAPAGTRQLLNGDKLRMASGGSYVGLVAGLGYTHTFTGDTTWTVILALSQPLFATQQGQTPDIPTLDIGDVVHVSCPTAPEGTVGTLSMEVAAPYGPADTSITLSYTGYAGLTVWLGFPTRLSITRFYSETKTVTNANTQWPDSREITVTWSGAVSIAGVWRVEWLDASDAVVGELYATGVVSGTSHAFQNRDARQIASGAQFRTVPQTLFAQSTAVANSAGVCVIPTGTISSAIVDNAVVRVPRNTIGWPDQGSGGTTRVRSSTGWKTSPSTIAVPLGRSKIAWAHFAAAFWYSRDDHGSATTTMTLEVRHAVTHAVLATVTTDAFQFETLVGTDRPLPVAQIAKVQFECTETTRVYLEASFTSALSYGDRAYAMASHAMITEGSDPDVPFTPSSHANAGFRAGVRYLTVYAREIRTIACTFAQLADIAGAQVVKQRVVIGQRVSLVDIGDSLRVMSHTRDHFNPHRSVFVLETLRRTASRYLGVGTFASGSGAITTTSGLAAG